MEETSTECEENENLCRNSDKAENLSEQINSLRDEKIKIEEEFGIQRAKMKDLFMQKENELKQQSLNQENLKSETKRLQTELDECRSQLMILSLDFQSKLESETRKYQEEISSLQHFLNETVEENGKYENENRELRYVNSKLTSELNELKHNNNNNNTSNNNVNNLGADMPQILSVPGTVISSIARKVTAQLTSSDSGSNNECNNLAPQSLDGEIINDSTRNLKKYAYEDATVLRSLCISLEEEVEALKDKLRQMDSDLRKYKNNSNVINPENSPTPLVSSTRVDSENVLKILDHSIQTNLPEMDENKENSVVDSSVLYEINNSTSRSTDKLATAFCDSCSNFETQLLNAQQKIYDLEKHIVSLERYKQELSKETAFRKVMEEKWNEKKEEYKDQVSSLQLKTLKAEETLKELRLTFTNTYEDVTQQLKSLCHDRERNQKELNRLQAENDDLIGKHSKHSQQLQNEVINLPDNVEELQEMILRCQEELICAKIAKEIADENMVTLMEEVTILRDQSQSDEKNRIELENTFTENMNKLKNDVHVIKQESNRHLEAYQGIDRDNDVLRKENKSLCSKIDKLIKSKKHLEETVNELRSQISSLQNELDNSEKVQKDFVLLSQSLQQELEKIRGAETEVRWEHEEDVIECRRCRNSFSVTRRKLHCKHCGRVFCSSCLTHTVNSGPNNRSSKVCDVCHTLLVQDSAPYFSTVPPQCDW